MLSNDLYNFSILSTFLEKNRYKAITRIINHPKLRNLPFFLETPNELEGYGREIKLLRENYKNLEEKLEKGYSIVFLIKKDVDTDEIDYQKIKKDMNKIFKKAEIIVLE